MSTFHENRVKQPWSLGACVFVYYTFIPILPAPTFAFVHLPILQTFSYSSMKRFAAEWALRLGCVAACTWLSPWWVLDWSCLVIISSFHFIHMKGSCILMEVKTRDIKCVAVCVALAAWWYIQVPLNMDPVKTHDDELRAWWTTLQDKANIVTFSWPICLTAPIFLFLARSFILVNVSHNWNTEYFSSEKCI